MQKLSANPFLTREERHQLMQKNDWKAAFEILVNLGWIAGAFALVYFWANPLTVIIALFIIGGQQLGLSVLMHDTGHKAVFKNPKLNDFVGQWIGAYPIFQDMYKYRDYHWVHHTTTGTEEDPDILLTRGYPTSPRSMMRKVFRDLSGQTGIKSFIGTILIHLGFLSYNLGKQSKPIPQNNRAKMEIIQLFFKKLTGPILINVLLFLFLSLFNPWLYMIWIGAFFTTHQFSIRVRSIAEHSMLEDPSDPLRNTRTTYANWWEKILFAPYHVNYHLEHHMLMGVPSYNLPKMHDLLKQRGFYDNGILAYSYWEVLKMTVNK